MKSKDRLKLELEKHNIPLAVLISDYIDLKLSFKKIARNLKEKEGITIANERNVRELLKELLPKDFEYKKGHRIKENSYADKLQKKEREIKQLKQLLQEQEQEYNNKLKEKETTIQELYKLCKYLFKSYCKAYEKQRITDLEFQELSDFYKETIKNGDEL